MLSFSVFMCMLCCTVTVIWIDAFDGIHKNELTRSFLLAVFNSARGKEKLFHEISDTFIRAHFASRVDQTNSELVYHASLVSSMWPKRQAEKGKVVIKTLNGGGFQVELQPHVGNIVQEFMWYMWSAFQQR